MKFGRLFILILVLQTSASLAQVVETTWPIIGKTFLRQMRLVEMTCSNGRAFQREINFTDYVVDFYPSGTFRVRMTLKNMDCHNDILGNYTIIEKEQKTYLISRFTHFNFRCRSQYSVDQLDTIDGNRLLNAELQQVGDDLILSSTPTPAEKLCSPGAKFIEIFSPAEKSRLN